MIYKPECAPLLTYPKSVDSCQLNYFQQHCLNNKYRATTLIRMPLNNTQTISFSSSSVLGLLTKSLPMKTQKTSPRKI